MFKKTLSQYVQYLDVCLGKNSDSTYDVIREQKYKIDDARNCNNISDDIYYDQDYANYFEFLKIKFGNDFKKDNKIYISEIKYLYDRLLYLNSLDLENAQIIDEDGCELSIDKKIIEEFKYTGLSNKDFIITNFYKGGFGQKPH